MPGLSDPEVIDLVSVTPDGATCCLHVVETEPWPDRPDPGCLNQKLLNYVGFALDGQLVATYPDVAGLPIRIEIDAHFKLTSAAVADLQLVKSSLSKYDIELTWNDDRSLEPTG
ncbi:DUF6572 domain-containing protein [Agromyces sp. NPDC058110]|uniref:DUF6572 domain-containing protein n=1 Tax=Agromyces sp. NPDC058110 TaxID=3346345 RepID=UPI0036DCAC49